jgi:SAM-dependent methyltransferase
MTLKNFYDNHWNFSARDLSEYYISPGIKCKFDLIWEKLDSSNEFYNAIDLGCSGNSILYLFNKKNHNSYLDITSIPLRNYRGLKKSHPICGDLSYLPYRENVFDFVTALDVLEHIADDERAIKEIERIMKKDAVSVISVPHRKAYFTKQDILIGHYRRYNIPELINLLRKSGIKKIIEIFGVYGLIMKVSFVQSRDPKQFEEGLLKLRENYATKYGFQLFWNIIVKLISRLMKLDAKYQPINKVMNIACIFKK